jgi:hypothetical protein
VYQPRGVGLMHTRHKPSNAYYTHEHDEQRKTSSPYESTVKSTGDLEAFGSGQVAESVTSTISATRPPHPPHRLEQ